MTSQLHIQLTAPYRGPLRPLPPFDTNEATSCISLNPNPSASSPTAHDLHASPPHPPIRNPDGAGGGGGGGRGGSRQAARRRIWDRLAPAGGEAALRAARREGEVERERGPEGPT
jgi:hypothetical protein